MRSISTQQVSDRGLPTLQLQQSGKATFSEVLPPYLAKSTSLVFAGDEKLFLEGIKNGSIGFIVTQKAWESTKSSVTPAMSVWIAPNIPQAMSLVLPLFDLKKDFVQPGIHPSAAVHPSAKISSSASIGPFCVIDAHAVVGDHTVLKAHIFVGAYCEIGARCHIASHVSIGSDGFGYFTDKKNVHHAIPQIGRVIIEDDCEIGAFSAVDRATITETRIKKGCKTDNFCHFGHNVIIGENGLMAASFRVAGSTKVGKNILAAGAVDIIGHVEVTDNVVLSGRAGVTSSITEPGVYGGFPLEPHRESVKTLVSIPQIKKIRKQVQKILKHLQLTDES